MRKIRNYWNVENSIEAALKFNSKRDFRKTHVATYEILRKSGNLNSACSHMENINHIIKWTFEKCREEALKCDTKVEFKKKCSWGYTVGKQNGWLDEITSHVIKYRHIQPIKWTKEMCHIEASKFVNRNDFRLKSSKAYAVCIRNKWLDDVCAHMNAPYTNKFRWTKEQIHQIALKYEHRKDFQNENKNAYYSAMYNGWLDDVCSHMVYQKLPNRYWHNFENCKNEVLKYPTKIEFVRGSQHVYNIALKNNWIDEICKHMIPIGNMYHRCIYSYEFPDNHVYVGLTYNIDVRQRNRDLDLTDTVTMYINKTKLMPVRKQLTDYIPVDDAIRLEGEFLLKYVNDGWIALNRMKTGGIGGGTRKLKFK